MWTSTDLAPPVITPMSEQYEKSRTRNLLFLVTDSLPKEGILTDNEYDIATQSFKSINNT